jgi:hypothetical protein
MFTAILRASQAKPRPRLRHIGKEYGGTDHVSGRFSRLGPRGMTVILAKASRAKALSLSSKFGAALRALHYASVVVGHARKDKATTANQQ